MKIDHLILFSQNVQASGAFFCELFLFEETDDDSGEEGGLVIHSKESDIVILEMPIERLPNPYHFAFQAESIAEFNSIHDRAKLKDSKPRKMPAKNSEPGIGEYERSGKVFKHFYIDDPSGSLIEVLYKG